MDEQNRTEMSEAAEARRDFLRKSVYAACATPVIMSLLVERADAAQSWNPGLGTRPPNQGTEPNPNHPVGPRNSNSSQGTPKRGW
jgi:hypothetical protein